MNTIKMSNSLDPDQARRIVGPDQGPNCLPKLSAMTLVDKEINIFYKPDEFLFLFFFWSRSVQNFEEI